MTGPLGLGLELWQAAIRGTGVLAYLTKADGTPITKADGGYILKGGK